MLLERQYIAGVNQVAVGYQATFKDPAIFDCDSPCIIHDWGLPVRPLQYLWIPLGILSHPTSTHCYIIWNWLSISIFCTPGGTTPACQLVMVRQSEFATLLWILREEGISWIILNTGYLKVDPQRWQLFWSQKPVKTFQNFQLKYCK